MNARLLPARAVAWSIAALTLALVAVGAADARSWRSLMSPGPVGHGHADIEDSCDKCHTRFSGAPDEKCLYCHQAVSDRIAAGEGFHASVSDQNCVACHTDHHGTDGPLTMETALERFDHGTTSFSLHGKHATLACATCHSVPLADMASQCAACHADPHDATHGTTCSACHLSDAWQQLTKSVAAHELPMHGGHEGLECVSCHGGGEHLEAEVECADCHVQAHGGTEAACETCHRVEGFQQASFDHSACTCALPEDHQTAPCLSCHEGWSFVDTPSACSGCHAEEATHEPIGECSRCHFATSWAKDGNFEHNRDASFALEAKHLEVSCAQCHGDLTDFRAAPTACLDCHAETGRVAHGDFGDCAGCHDTTGFDRSTFDHATTGFTLSGQHTALDCEDCHGGGTGGEKAERRGGPSYLRLLALDAARDGRAPPVRRAVLDAGAPSFRFAQHDGGAIVRDCADCHEDAHAGSVGTDCASCHTPDAWSPSTFDRARHARSRLPLDGAHAAVDCAQCHLGGRLKPLSPACADCHMDRHAGKLGDDCAECHDATAFAPVPGFDHARTGFALEGPHEAQACEACHGAARGPALQAAAAPSDCRTCHVAPHNDDLGDDCTSCHPVAHGATFADAEGMAFPHASTGFRLVERHKSLACGQCHQPDHPRPNGQCAECHLDPHAGGMSPDCEMCHRPDRWRLARFDHSQSGWPLRGRHQVTPCASCHVNQRWVGLDTDCFGCHALDAERAPAIPPHRFGPTDCQRCHNLWTWRRG